MRLKLCPSLLQLLSLLDALRQAGSSSSSFVPTLIINHCTSLYPERRGSDKRKRTGGKKGGWEDHTPGRRTALFMCSRRTINKTAAAIKEFSARLLWGHCVSRPSCSVQDWRAAQDWFPLWHLLKSEHERRVGMHTGPQKEFIWPFG